MIGYVRTIMYNSFKKIFILSREPTLLELLLVVTAVEFNHLLLNLMMMVETVGKLWIITKKRLN